MTAGPVSSSSMVPAAVFSVPSTAFDDWFDSVTVKVSSSSSTVSFPVATEMVPDVCSALMVSSAPLAGAV